MFVFCNRLRLSLLTVLLFLPVMTQAETTGSSFLQYQGNLLSDDGQPESGAFVFRFSLWDSADFLNSQVTDGQLVTTDETFLGWSEVQTQTLQTSGQFRFNLGSVVNFPPNVFAQNEVYLQVEVRSETGADVDFELIDTVPNDETQDRQLLTAVPFAFSADKLDFRDAGLQAGEIPFLNSEARLDRSAGADGTIAESFTIEGDEESASLNFGQSLGAALQFDVLKNLFVLNRDLDLSGQEIKQARLENLAVAPVCDPDSEGRIYQDTSLSQTLICVQGSWDRLDNGPEQMSFAFEADLAPGEENLFQHLPDIDLSRLVEVYEIGTEVLSETLNFFTSEAEQFTVNPVGEIDFRDDQLRLRSQGVVIDPTEIANNPVNVPIASDIRISARRSADNNANTHWFNATGFEQGLGVSAGQWWGIDFNQPVTIGRASMQQLVGQRTGKPFHATLMNIEGSDDGVTWNLVDQVKPEGGDLVVETWDFTPQTYRFWRFFCVEGIDPQIFAFYEGDFFTASFNDFVSTPVTVSTVGAKTIDTSIWSRLNQVNITSEEPENTSLRYLFSFDNGVTWRKFSDEGWVEVLPDQIATDGLTTTEVSNLSNLEWGSSGGLNSGSGTLDILVSFQTAEASVTPVLRDLSFDYEVDFQEERGAEMARVRLYTPMQTGVSNVSLAPKSFRVVITFTPEETDLIKPEKTEVSTVPEKVSTEPVQEVLPVPADL